MKPRPLSCFFDLFFVANLTIFAIDHEINDGASMSPHFTVWFPPYLCPFGFQDVLMFPQLNNHISYLCARVHELSLDRV